MSKTDGLSRDTLGSNRQSHVAFFLPDLMGGGAEKVMSLIASGLADRGFRVDFVLVKARGIHLQTLSTKVRVVNLDSTNAYSSFPRLVRYLRSEQPDVLFSSLNLTNLISLLAIRLVGAKTRSFIRIANTISSQKRAPWKKYLERVLISRIFPWANEIIAVSQTVAQDMADYTRIPFSKIRVIYNPVLLDLPSDKATVHPWFQNSDRPVVLGIGRLTAQKDFKTLLQAFALVRQKSPVRLIILGEGELRDELDILAANLNIRQDVDFPGYVKDTYYFLRNSGAFVLSSAWEGLPNVLIEALVCNCPVVSTDCPGGVREILEDGKYGELVPVGDPVSMANAIGRVLDGRGKRVDAEWLDRFSFDRIIDRVENLIVNEVDENNDVVIT